MRELMAIRSKVAEVRHEKNMKQLDLAVALGIDPSQLRRIEGIGKSGSSSINKSINIEILDNMCRLLRCQPGDLFVYEGEEL